MSPQRGPDGGLFPSKKCLSLLLALSVSLAVSACKKETATSSSPTPIPSAAQSARTSPAPAAAPAQPEKRPAVQESLYSYDPAGRPDPFAPLVLAQEREEPKKGRGSLQVATLKLTGIVWDKKGHVALVEAPDKLGYVLRVNDQIGKAARVSRITSKSVTFEVTDNPYLAQSRVREVELTLKKEE